jgi:hypothetical protein
VKQIRKRLTYANVMSSIAVFLVVGGATAFAAGHLGKNTVGTKQLKKNAVTTKKIKKNAVTTAKIRKEAVTGAKIKLSSLGTVPSATNAVHASSADNAANAAHANNADNANATNGMHLAKLHFVSGPDAPKTTIFSEDGLTLYAECEGESLEFTGTTSVANSEIYESGNYLNTYDGNFSDEFNPGDVEEIGNNIGDGSQDEVQGQLVFSTPAGANVTAEFYLNDFESYGGTSNCSVQGTVVFS